VAHHLKLQLTRDRMARSAVSSSLSRSMNVARFSKVGVADTTKRRQVTLPAMQHKMIIYTVTGLTPQLRHIMA
jgi:hypothetical protein